MADTVRTPILDEKTARADALKGITDPGARSYDFTKEVSINGKKMTGAFTCKVMSVTDRMRAGTIRARLLDGAPSASLDNVTDDIAFMVGYLTVALTKKPSWWDIDQLDSIDDLYDIYKTVNDFQQSFRTAHEHGEDAGRGTDATGKETMEPV